MSGQLYVDGMAYVVQAKVSGTKGYGALGNPASGTIMEFGILARDGNVYVFFPESAGSPEKAFQFQRGASAVDGASAKAERRARRRERAKRAFAGLALIGIAAAAASNSDTSSGNSSGGSSGAGGDVSVSYDPNPTNDAYLPGGDSYVNGAEVY